MSCSLYTNTNLERACALSKYFEVHVTIAISGVDIDIHLLANLKVFIKDSSNCWIVFVEGGGGNTLKMVVKGIFSRFLLYGILNVMKQDNIYLVPKKKTML